MSLLTDKEIYALDEPVGYKVQVLKDGKPMLNTPVDLEVRSQTDVLEHVVVLTDSDGYAKGTLSASSLGVLVVRAIVYGASDVKEITVVAPTPAIKTPSQESALTLTSGKNSYVFGEDVEMQVRYKPAVAVDVIVIGSGGNLVLRENVKTDYLGYASVVLQPEPGDYYVSAVASDGASEKASFNVLPRVSENALGKPVKTRLGIASVNESEAASPYLVTMVKNRYYVGPNSVLRVWVSVVDNQTRPISGATVQFKVSYDAAGNETLSGSVMNLTSNSNGNANFSYTIPSNVNVTSSSGRMLYVHAKVGNTSVYEPITARKTITVAASTDKSTYGLNDTLSISADVDGPEYDYYSGVSDPLLGADVVAQILGTDVSAGNTSVVQLTDSNNKTNVSIDIVNAKVTSSYLYVYVNYTSGSLSSVSVKLYDPNGTVKDSGTVYSSSYATTLSAAYYSYPDYVLPSGEWKVELTGSGSSYSVPVQVRSSYSVRNILSEVPLDDSDGDAVYAGSYTTQANPAQLGSYEVSVTAAKGNLTNGTDTVSFTLSADNANVYTDRESTGYTPLYGFGNTVTIYASINDTKTGVPLSNANVSAYVKSPSYNTVSNASVVVVNKTLNASYNFSVNKTGLNSVSVGLLYSFLGSYGSTMTAYLLDENGTQKDYETVYDGSTAILSCDSASYYTPCNLSTGTWQILIVPSSYYDFNNTQVNLTVTLSQYFDWNVSLAYSNGLYSGSMQTPDPSVLSAKNVEGTYSVSLLARDSRGYNATDTTQFLAFLDNVSLSVDAYTYLPNDTVTITALVEDMASLAGATGANVTANVSSDYGVIAEEAGSVVVNSSVSKNVSFSVPANTTGTKIEATVGFGTSWSYSNYRSVKLYDPDGVLVDSTSYLYQGYSDTLTYTSTNGTLKPGNWTLSSEAGSGTYSDVNFNYGFEVERKDEYIVSLTETGSGVYTGPFQLRSDAVLGQYTVGAVIIDRNLTFTARIYGYGYMSTIQALFNVEYVDVSLSLTGGVPASTWYTPTDCPSGYGRCYDAGDNIGFTVTVKNAKTNALVDADVVNLTVYNTTYSTANGTLQHASTGTYSGSVRASTKSPFNVSYATDFYANASAVLNSRKSAATPAEFHVYEPSMNLTLGRSVYASGDNISIRAGLWGQMNETMLKALRNLTAVISNYANYTSGVITLADADGDGIYTAVVSVPSEIANTSAGRVRATAETNYTENITSSDSQGTFHLRNYSVHVSTNKAYYIPNESVNITINVTTPGGTPVTGAALTVNVSLTETNSSWSPSVTEAGGGIYAATFSGTGAGTYLISVDAVKDGKTASGLSAFTIVSELPIYLITFSYPAYVAPGQSVNKTLTVRDSLNNESVQGATVNLVLRRRITSIYDSTEYSYIMDHIQGLVTNANGEAVVNYTVPSGFPNGNYRWDIQAVKGNQSGTGSDIFQVRAYSIDGFTDKTNYFTGEYINVTVKATSILNNSLINVSQVNVTIYRYASGESIYNGPISWIALGTYSQLIQVPANASQTSFYLTYTAVDAQGNIESDSGYINVYAFDEKAYFDWEDYARSENATVYVSVWGANYQPIPGMNISVTVYNPNGSILSILSTDNGTLAYASGLGLYSGVVNISENASLGTYSATVRKVDSYGHTDYEYLHFSVVKTILNVYFKKGSGLRSMDVSYVEALVKDFKTGNPANNTIFYRLKEYSSGLTIRSGNLTPNEFGFIALQFNASEFLSGVTAYFEVVGEGVSYQTSKSISQPTVSSELLIAKPWYYYSAGSYYTRGETLKMLFRVINNTVVPYNMSNADLLNGTPVNITVYNPDTDSYFSYLFESIYYSQLLTTEQEYGKVVVDLTLTGRLYQVEGAYDDSYSIYGRAYNANGTLITSDSVMFNVMLMNISFNTSKSCFNQTENTTFTITLLDSRTGAVVSGAKVNMSIGTYSERTYYSTTEGTVVDLGNGTYIGNATVSPYDTVIFRINKSDDFVYNAKFSITQCTGVSSSSDLNKLEITLVNDTLLLGDVVVLNIQANRSNGQPLRANVSVFRTWASGNGVYESGEVLLGVATTDTNGRAQFSYRIPERAGGMFKGGGAYGSYGSVEFEGKIYNPNSLSYNGTDYVYAYIRKLFCDINLSKYYYNEREIGTVIVNTTDLNNNSMNASGELIIYSSSYYFDWFYREFNSTGVFEQQFNNSETDGTYYARTFLFTRDGWTCFDYTPFYVYRYNVTITKDKSNYTTGETVTVNITVTDKNTGNLTRNVTLYVEAYAYAYDYYYESQTKNFVFVPQVVLTSQQTTHNFQFNLTTSGNATLYIIAEVFDGDGRYGYSYVYATVLSILGSPTVTITSPMSGHVVTTNNVTVTYAKSGNLSEVDHVQLQLDSGSEVADNDGTHTFTSVSDGSHTVHAWLAKADNSHLSNTEAHAQVNFTVNTTVDTRRPQVVITSPSDGATTYEGTTINLTGYAYDPVTGGNVSGSALSWSSSLDGSLGTGSLLSVNLSVGNHTITLTATGGNGQANTTSITVRVLSSPYPDLRVTRVVPSSTPVIKGVVNQIEVNVSNTGNSNASNVSVKLYANATLAGEKTIASIAAGGQEMVQFNWTPEAAGVNILRAVADEANSITETREGNNELNRTVIVQQPNVRVYHISRPYNAMVNEAVNITGYVYSNFNYNGLNVSFSVNGTAVESRLVNVTSGDNLVVFAWTPTLVGSYPLTVTADADGRISELSEDDNAHSKVINVKTADLELWVMDVPKVVLANTTTDGQIYTYSDIAMNGIRTVAWIENESGSMIQVIKNSTDDYHSGVSTRFNWTTPTQAGIYYVKGAIDPTNTVQEDNKANNNKTFSVRIVVVQFNITGRNIPDTVLNGDNFWAGISYRSSDPVRANATIDLPASVTLGGGSRTITFDAGDGYGWLGWWLYAARPDENAILNVTITYPGRVIQVQLNVTILPKGVIMKSSHRNATLLINETRNLTLNLTLYNVTYEQINATVCYFAGSEGALIRGLDDLIGYPHGCVEQKMSKHHPNLMIKKYYKVNGRLTTQLNATIAERIRFGITSLEQHQTIKNESDDRNGGWGWFEGEYYEPTPYFSQYALYGLCSVRNDEDYGFMPNNTRILLGVSWLLRHQNADGSWTPGGHDYVREPESLTGLVVRTLEECRRNITNATILNTINSSIVNATNYLLSRQSGDGSWSSNVYPTALSLIGLENSMLNWTNVTNAIGNGTSWLASHQNADGSWTTNSWLSYGWNSRVAGATGYGILALYGAGYLNNESHVYSASQYIISHFSDWGWESTQATAIAIHALVALNMRQNINVNVVTNVEGTQVSGSSLSDELTEVCIDITSYIVRVGSNTVTILMNGTGQVGYHLLLRQWVFLHQVPPSLLPYVDPIAENYSISMTLSNTTIKVNENVTVSLSIQNNATENLTFMMVSVPLPAGFTAYPPTPSVAYSVNTTNGSAFFYPEVIPALGTFNISYAMKAGSTPINASLKAKISPMYNPEYLAESDAKNLTVISDADITVKNVTVTSPSGLMLANETKNITTILENKGSLSENISIQLYVNDVLLDTANVTVASKSTYTYSYLNWSSSSGSFSVKVLVPQVSGETESADNQLQQAARVYSGILPDLNVTLVSMPSQIRVDDNATINVTVVNTGIAAATNASLSLKAGNTVVDVATITAGVGATATASLTWSPSAEGQYNLTAEVLTDDLNTQDNTKTSSVTVLPSGGSASIQLTTGWNLISMPLNL